MKFQAFLRGCVSVAVVLLISLSIFATQAFALDESGVEQLKNNYDSQKTSINNIRIPQLGVGTPPLSHQEPTLPPHERLNNGEINTKTKNNKSIEIKSDLESIKLKPISVIELGECDCVNLDKNTSEIIQYCRSNCPLK